MDLFRTLFVSLFASAVMAVDCTPSIYIASVPFNDPMPFTGRLTSTGPGCPHNNATYTLSNGGAIMSVGFSQLYSVVIGAQIFEPSTYCSFSVKLKYPQGCSSDSLFLAVIPRGSTDLDKGVGASYEMRIKVGSRYTKVGYFNRKKPLYRILLTLHLDDLRGRHFWLETLRIQ